MLENNRKALYIATSLIKKGFELGSDTADSLNWNLSVSL